MINSNFLNEPNLLDLTNEIFNFILLDKNNSNISQNLLNNKFYEAETVNFVLADGLGYENLISTESKLKKFVTGKINSTFPTSTNVALSTIAFNANPIEHGILGYYLFDRKKNSLMNALNWKDEKSNFSHGKHFENQNTIWKQFKKNSLFVSNFQPKNLVNSRLSNLLYEKSMTLGYEDTYHLLDFLSDPSILENRFNFVYYPNIDVAAHVFGVGSIEWNKEVREFETFIWKLVETSNKKTCTVISADHGLVNIDKNKRHHLNDEKLNIYGDQRAVYINGSKDDVLYTFRNIPGTLLNSNELTSLLGKPKTNFVKDLFPDYCFLVEDQHIVYPSHLKTELAAYHGGISDQELKIPIIELSNF